jgi:hypothetical protein
MRGLHQLSYKALPKSREALIMVPKRPRSEGRTLFKEVNPLQTARDSMRPRTYLEVLMMAINKRDL